jgi:hypothetical protein
MELARSELGDESDVLITTLGLDLAHVIVTCLDVNSTIAVGGASSTWRRLVHSDELHWRAHAAALGVHELPDGITSWLLVVQRMYPLLPGDALIVKDTFNIFASARVMIKLGAYLLVHYEGWSNGWFMWLHRVHDAPRIRPLSAQPPGVGTAGAHTEQTFRAFLDQAHGTLRQRREWQPTSGSRLNGEWPHPYVRPPHVDASELRPGARYPFVPPASDAEIAAAIATPVRAFRTLYELAADRPACLAAFAAATALAPSAGADEGEWEEEEEEEEESDEEEGEEDGELGAALADLHSSGGSEDGEGSDAAGAGPVAPADWSFLDGGGAAAAGDGGAASSPPGDTSSAALEHARAIRTAAMDEVARGTQQRLEETVETVRQLREELGRARHIGTAAVVVAALAVADAVAARSRHPPPPREQHPPRSRL